MSDPLYRSNTPNFSTPGSGSDVFSTSSDQSRTLPRQVSTGSLRGTQTVGYGGVQIDGSNNRIVLGASGLPGGGTVGADITLDGANSVITIGNNIKLDGTSDTITVGSSITIDGVLESISVKDNNKTVLTMGKNTNKTFNFRVLDENGKGLAQFGKFSNGSTALKIAKSGIEVDTAQDSQLIFNSNQNIFKIVVTNTISVTTSVIAPFGIQTTTIAHGLGIIPAFLCYTTIPNSVPGNTLNPGLTCLPALASIPDGSGLGTVFVWVTARADATNLYIDICAPTSAGLGAGRIFAFRYYILQESSATS